MPLRDEACNTSALLDLSRRRSRRRLDARCALARCLELHNRQRSAAGGTRRGAGTPRRRHCGWHGVTCHHPSSVRRAIAELFERWGDIDGGYRKLAHRRSPDNLVLGATRQRRIPFSKPRRHGPAPLVRSAHPAPARPSAGLDRMAVPSDLDLRQHPFPQRLDGSPTRILDVSHPQMARHALVTAEETATQVEVVFNRNHSTPRACSTHTSRPPTAYTSPPRRQLTTIPARSCWPCQTAMTPDASRYFWGSSSPFCSIAARFGRPGTPTDQAWIETLFRHRQNRMAPPSLENHRPAALLAGVSSTSPEHDLWTLPPAYASRVRCVGLADDEHARASQSASARFVETTSTETASSRLIAYHAQQQTQPALNTPAQYGAIKPPLWCSCAFRSTSAFVSKATPPQWFRNRGPAAAWNPPATRTTQGTRRRVIPCRGIS